MCASTCDAVERCAIDAAFFTSSLERLRRFLRIPSENAKRDDAVDVAVAAVAVARHRGFDLEKLRREIGRARRLFSASDRISIVSKTRVNPRVCIARSWLSSGTKIDALPLYGKTRMITLQSPKQRFFFQLLIYSQKIIYDWFSYSRTLFERKIRKDLKITVDQSLFL